MRVVLFPLFLKLAGRRVVLVGGGSVAAQKLPGLLAAGARVRVVAPAIRDALRLPGVDLAQRPFDAHDLDGAWLAVAAATPDVNRAVALAAGARHVFVNAVDDARNASAYLGGVVHKSGVTLAVSTDGRAPALAGLLREALEDVLPEDLARWTDVAAALRAGWQADGVPMGRRRPLLLDALNRLYAARGVPEAARSAAEAVAP
jgi:uroporphyrin-III C-methyltransferase/precorrin-2 dehydrogenase/sirohydrochlorin ferrochelatase